MATNELKLYAHIKQDDVDKVNYNRIDFSQSINWGGIFPTASMVKSDTIKKANTYNGGAEDIYVAEMNNASYFEDRSLKGKFPVEKGQTVITNTYPITFDIETNPDGTSWIQQWTIGNTTIKCHGWDETMSVYRVIEEEMWRVQANLLPVNTYPVATILIANLGFEFQFLRKRLEFTGVFATASRSPLSAQTERLYFRDPLRLSNSSLVKLSDLYNLPTKKAVEVLEDGTVVSDLDYSKYRTTKWALSDKENEYVCNDVEILADFWRWCIHNYAYKGVNIPLTATGIDRDTVKQLAKQELQHKEYVTDKQGNPVYAKNGQQKTKNVISKFGKMLPKMFPETLEEYDDLMTMTFVGGYTKSSMVHSGQELTNVNGGDFTSSYPSVMFNETFPMTPYRDIAPQGITIDDVLANAETKSYIMMIRFKGIKATTAHSVQSLSKTYEYYECKKRPSRCVEEYNMIIDNGRVHYAKQMTVSITELDLQTFSEYYDWESYEILTCKISDKDYLPDYIRYAVVIYYQMKAQLKRSGLAETTAYRIAKAMVNALYGMMCEKIHIVQDVCNTKADDCWSKSVADADREHVYKCQIYGVSGDPDDPKDYETQCKTIKNIESGRQITNKFLSPYWAVYVTAHARRNLLCNVYKAHESVIYCDTDSMYFIDDGNARSVMNDWNTWVHGRNMDVMNEWNGRHGFDRDEYECITTDEDKETYLRDTRGVLTENLIDLGEFDVLNPFGNYTRFKALGCKRYLKTGPEKNKKGEIVEKTVATIAGLPKKALLEYCEKEGKDPYEVFVDGMVIPNCKKTHTYIDEAYDTTITDEQGNTEVMHEESAIVIRPIDFSMRLSDMYKQILAIVGEEMRQNNTDILNTVHNVVDQMKEVLGFED